jgi:hypothetical protein
VGPRCVSVRTMRWTEWERAMARARVHLRSERPSMFRRKTLSRGEVWGWGERGRWWAWGSGWKGGGWTW